MSKGVSAILATVLIVLVTVSLSGAFLIYTQRTGVQLTESGTQSAQALQQQLDVQFILEGVSGNQASLRNIGENAITYGTLSVFLDDVLINYTLTAPIHPGQTGTLYLNQTWKAGLGERTLRVAGRSLSDSVRVRVDKPAGNVLDLRFDDGSGTTAKDSSPFGNNGGLNKDPQWIEGRFGKALDFDGAGDYVSVLPSDSLRLSANNETVELWVKHSSTNTFFQGAGWSRRLFGSVWVFTDMASNYYYPSAYGSDDQQWHLIGYSISGRTIRSYVDGNLITTITTTADVCCSATGEWWIGRVCGGITCDSYYQGSVDEVRIYNRAYAPEELYIINKA